MATNKNRVLKKGMHSLVTTSLPTLTESVPSHSKESDVGECEILSSVPDDSENNFLHEGCEFVDLLDKETILDMSFEDEQCDAIDELLPFDVTTNSLSLVEKLLSLLVMFSVSRRAMEYLLTILRRHEIDVLQMIYSVKKCL